MVVSVSLLLFRERGRGKKGKIKDQTEKTETGRRKGQKERNEKMKVNKEKKGEKNGEGTTQRRMETKEIKDRRISSIIVVFLHFQTKRLSSHLGRNLKNN